MCGNVFWCGVVRCVGTVRLMCVCVIVYVNVWCMCGGWEGGPPASLWGRSLIQRVPPIPSMLHPGRVFDCPCGQVGPIHPFEGMGGVHHIQGVVPVRSPVPPIAGRGPSPLK